MVTKGIILIRSIIDLFIHITNHPPLITHHSPLTTKKMLLPPHIDDIFEILSKGQFICSNSTQPAIVKLYNIIDDANNFEVLHDYFSHINFLLEKGDEFYYFSRKESKADLERKIKRMYEWIDIVDFLKTYDNSFGAGFRVSPQEILYRAKTDVELEDKLNALKKLTDKDNQQEILERVLEMLVRDTFMEQENAITNTYKVLASFKYLEQLILAINIPTDLQHAKSK